MNSVYGQSVRIAEPEDVLRYDVTSFYDQHLRVFSDADFPRIEERRDFLTQGGVITDLKKIDTGLWEAFLSTQGMNKPIKVKFKTISVNDFFKDALDIKTNIYQITKPESSPYGFSIGEGSGNVYLTISKHQVFGEDLIFNGIKINSTSYKHNRIKNVLEVDTPYIKGTIYLVLI